MKGERRLKTCGEVGENSFSEKCKLPRKSLQSSVGKPSVRILPCLPSGQVRAALTSGNRIPSREKRSAGKPARDSALVPRTANQVKSPPMIPHRILIYKVFPKSGCCRRPHGLWLSELMLYSYQCVGCGATRMSL